MKILFQYTEPQNGRVILLKQNGEGAKYAYSFTDNGRELTAFNEEPTNKCFLKKTLELLENAPDTEN